MNRMQHFLKRAGEELSLSVTMGPTMTLSDGIELNFEAWFPDLSGPKGILIWNSDNGSLDRMFLRELTVLGYGVSQFGRPLEKEVFDLENYVEMFQEWGWSGKASQRPSWIVHEERS